jgi:hypothetical protein
MNTGIYTLTTDGLEQQCNSVKDILLRKLYDDGLISVEEHNDFVTNYAFIIRKPSFFGSFWNKILKHDHTTYILVKQQVFKESDESDDDNTPKLKVIDLNNHKKEK